MKKTKKLTDAVVVGGVPGIDSGWVHEPTEKKIIFLD